MRRPSRHTASIKAAFHKARIPELTAVVLPDFITDSLASRRHRRVEETSSFWQVNKAEQTTGTYSVAIVLISNQ